MTTKDLFDIDIDVPDSVQNKANDAFAQIKKENDEQRKKKKMKFAIIKKLVAVAASIAVALGIYESPVVKNANSDSKMQNTVQKETTEGAEEKFAIGPDFTLKVNAAELTEGQPFLFDENGVSGFSFASLQIKDHPFSQEAEIILDRFTIEGENVATITYSVTGGVFGITHKEGVTPVKNGVVDEEFTKSYSFGDGQYFDEELDSVEPGVEDFYDSFTIDYENQAMPNTTLDVRIPYFDNEAYFKYMYLGLGDFNYKRAVELYDELFKDTIITVTVQYEDGSIFSKDIVFDCYYTMYAPGGKGISFAMRCKDDTPLDNAYCDDNCNIVELNLPEDELEYGPTINETDSGIQFGDKINATVSRLNSDGSLELVGTSDFYLYCGGEVLYPEHLIFENDETSFEMSLNYADVADAVNQFVGSNPGDSFIVKNSDTGISYQYTINSYVTCEEAYREANNEEYNLE